MKLSTKSRYAIIALIDMIEQGVEKVVSLVSIAERQNLPLAYLEQIFLKLRKGGIVQSSRGFYGGYSFGQPIAQISICDIVCAVDTIQRTQPCNGINKGCMPHGASCLTHQLWTAIDHVLFEYLGQLSLEDVYRSTLKNNKNSFMTLSDPTNTGGHDDVMCVYDTK